ncbi:unnamed protein product [Caenorhabditis bovis]|uniref:Uncharacterized protein n=1 Tax=Caenorhabditis bovis TaxID=2654633 RepID=A0A8S1F626_9PELO|nr:unnamed protein product [Caenorhabditis bovis]
MVLRCRAPIARPTVKKEKCAWPVRMSADGWRLPSQRQDLPGIRQLGPSGVGYGTISRSRCYSTSSISYFEKNVTCFIDGDQILKYTG